MATEGKLTVEIPADTVGYVVNNTEYGSMVQWRVNVNGWEILLAQLQVSTTHGRNEAQGLKGLRTRRFLMAYFYLHNLSVQTANTLRKCVLINV